MNSPTQDFLSMGSFSRSFLPMDSGSHSLFSSLSDSELYTKCKEYGGNARFWRRKFAGLLPEASRRRLYKKRGYASIHEFAAKLAGMSFETVDKILRLAERLRDKPALLELLESGSQGWSKIEIVAYIVTSETDREWAEKVKTLGTQALRDYVTELRKIEKLNQPIRLDFTDVGDSKNIRLTSQGAEAGKSVVSRQLPGIASRETAEQATETLYRLENGILDIKDGDRNTDTAKTSCEDKLLPGLKTSPRKNFLFSLQEEVAAALIAFRLRLEKERKETLTWNEVITELLQGYDRLSSRKPLEQSLRLSSNQPDSTSPITPGFPENMQEKPRKSKQNIVFQLCPECVKKKIHERENRRKQEGKKIPRKIPAEAKRLVEARSNGFCEFPGCSRAYETSFHHTKRFGLNPSHNPDFIVLLCRGHERLVHSGLIENEEAPPLLWRIRYEPDRNSPKYPIDQKVMSYRKEAIAVCKEPGG